MTDLWKMDMELGVSIIAATRAYLAPYPTSLAAYEDCLIQLRKDYPRPDQADARLRYVLGVLSDGVNYGNFPK